MSTEYWLMDERARDAKAFGVATVYAVARTLREAQRDQDEAGCGVIIKVEIAKDGEAEWQGVAAAHGGTSRTVELKSGGGTLTVSVSLDPFALDDDDQKFVFELINKLRDYEKA